MIKIVDRLLLFIYSLAVLLAGCFALSIVLGAVSHEQTAEFLTDLYTDSITKYIWMICFAFIVLISLRLIYVSVRRGRGQAPSIDQRTEVGDIRISMETVENLSLKAANRIRGVKDLKCRVRVGNAGLEIIIRTIVDGEMPIPAMTEEIQNAVKSHIEEITGIPVASVSVFVANIAQSAATFKSRVE